MALEDVQERLRDDPETVQIDLAGEEKPFLLSTLGMERARQKDDPLPVLLDIIQRYAHVIDMLRSDASITDEDVQEALKERIRGGDLSDLSLVLWSGFLTFDEDITLEEVQLLMTPGRIIKSGVDIATALMSFLSDMDTSAVPDPEEVEPDDVSGN